MATLGIFHPSVYTFNQSLIARVIIFPYSHIYHQQTTHSFWVSMNIEHQIKLYFTSFKTIIKSLYTIALPTVPIVGEKHRTLVADTAMAWDTQKGRFFTSLTQPRFETHRREDFFTSLTQPTNIIPKENHPRNIPPNFASEWFCSFRALDWNVKSTPPLTTYTKL